MLFLVICTATACDDGVCRLLFSDGPKVVFFFPYKLMGLWYVIVYSIIHLNYSDSVFSWEMDRMLNLRSSLTLVLEQLQWIICFTFNLPQLAYGYIQLLFNCILPSTQNELKYFVATLSNLIFCSFEFFFSISEVKVSQSRGIYLGPYSPQMLFLVRLALPSGRCPNIVLQPQGITVSCWSDAPSGIDWNKKIILRPNSS